MVTGSASPKVEENPKSAYGHGRDHDMTELHKTLDQNVWGL